MLEKLAVILGGGIGGLSAGHYLNKLGLPFVVLEAGDRHGGNCVTFEVGGFRFDSGAHRVHGRDPVVTAEVRDLLGQDLVEVDIPSVIRHNGKGITFPLTLSSMLRALGPATAARAALEIAMARMTPMAAENFQSISERKYGKTLAEDFLLNYSEKLWGLPTAELSPSIAGERLKGLDPRGFIKQSLSPSSASRRDMEGRFYYPARGIGQLADALAQSLETRGDGRHNPGRQTRRLLLDARVTRIVTEGTRVVAVETSEGRSFEPSAVVNSMPLNIFLYALDPPPPSRILGAAGKLQYRSVALAALFIKGPGITGAATVYFPDRRFPFTRVCEPRNRSERMSPPDHTSLVGEFPCMEGGDTWNMPDEALLDIFGNEVAGLGWLDGREVVGGAVRMMSSAYPVLRAGYEEIRAEILDWLGSFENLWLTGRSGKFEYSWIHNIMRESREIAEDIGSL